MHQSYNYLALGDSYTIGEGVPVHQSFPYQLVQLLRKNHFNCAAPEIVARTGWSSDELLQAVKRYKFMPAYQFATLLIGVNNQYRRKEVMQFKMDFERLIRTALTMVGGKKSHLIVLTIPDYSVTPYAANMDVQGISKEIDVYNSLITAICLQYKLPLVNITGLSRKAGENESLLTADKLHPSAKEYGKWAKKLLPLCSKLLK